MATRFRSIIIFTCICMGCMVILIANICLFKDTYRSTYTRAGTAIITWTEYNNTNPRYIDYDGFTVKLALLCIGAQATGTSSLRVQWDNVPEGIVSDLEMHWFTHG
eukprot:359504_1